MLIYHNGEVRYVEPLEIMIDDENDLTDLDVQPGTIAFTAGGVKKWQLGADESWVSMVPEEPATNDG